MEQAVNTFGKGLVTDYNPLLAPENTLTDALNATFVTMNGNEAMLQNDMGNGRVETAFLPSGFVPVGIKEHGGIIYVASHNPLTGESQVGSFPSPERNIDSREQEGNLDLGDIVNRGNINNWCINDGERERDALTETVPLFNGKTLNPGDKFAIVISTSGKKISDYKQYLSHCYNTDEYKVNSPKLSESEISVLVQDSTKNLSDITDTLIRYGESNESNESEEEDPIDLDEQSEEFKRNYKYFIWDDFNGTQESDYFNPNATFENTRKVNNLNLNTFQNKFSGSLFLSRKYNTIDHIDYDNVEWKSSTGDPTVIKGTLSFDLIYYYNCPDGFYYISSEEDPSSPGIKWKKGNWQIEQPNSNNSTLSSPVNLNFVPTTSPNQESYSYGPNYDISTGLYKFVIPYKVSINVDDQGQLHIGKSEIDETISDKNPVNNEEASNYNYISWIGQNYDYSVIQGSNIKASYDKGLCTFIITPKMYYTKPLEDLAISFTMQLAQEVTPGPAPTPEPGSIEWKNEVGFGYVWDRSQDGGNNHYRFLFNDKYFEKENGEYKYEIFLHKCVDYVKENDSYKWEWQDSINILDESEYEWNTVNDIYWQDSQDNIRNVKTHYHNIGPNDYFGYVEINDTSIEQIKGKAEPSGKYQRFWIFPRNIKINNKLQYYYEGDAELNRLNDTFDTIYTPENKLTPRNKLILSYYPPLGNVTVIKGIGTGADVHRMFKSQNNVISNINLNYILSKDVPQSICKALSENITGNVLTGYEVQIVVAVVAASPDSSPITQINDYFYPLYKYGKSSTRGTEEFTLTLDDAGSESESETIDVILNPLKGFTLEGFNFIENSITLKFKLEVTSINVPTESTFNFTKDNENEVQSNTITEIISNNYTKVN